MTRRSALALAVTLLLPGGCAASDPYARPGMWQPEGVNAVNLAAMAARPADLVQGRSDRGSDGIEAARAVHRLWEGKRVSLPGAAATDAAARSGSPSGSSGESP